MRIDNIFKNSDVIIPQKICTFEANKVCIDADKASSDTIFISLHSSIEEESRAISLGCRIIVSNRSDTDLPIITLYSNNPRKTYAIAAYNLSEIENYNIKIIGITGTCGKTSVATIIYEILNSCNIKCGFIGTGMIKTHNKDIQEEFYSFTTPDPEILYPALKELAVCGCRYVVMEVSSHSLYYDKVSPLRFVYSIFTNLSAEHLDFHKNMEEYYSCKKKLALLSDTIIINFDDYFGRRLYNEADCATIGIGCLWDSDISIRCIDFNNLNGISYLYRGNGFSFIAHSRLSGAFNVYNTALAITAAISIGIPPYQVKEALKEFEAIPGRLQKISNSPMVIIDYAHTPAGVENVLKLLRGSCSKSLRVIFGCGGERDTLKRPVMAKICETYADYIIVTTDNPRTENPDRIINDIVAGFSPNTNYKIVRNRKDAINEMIINAQNDDIIAILGKGAETYTIDSDGYHSYNDSDSAKTALKFRSENTRYYESKT